MKLTYNTTVLDTDTLFFANSTPKKEYKIEHLHNVAGGTASVVKKYLHDVYHITGSLTPTEKNTFIDLVQYAEITLENGTDSYEGYLTNVNLHNFGDDVVLVEADFVRIDAGTGSNETVKTAAGAVGFKSGFAAVPHTTQSIPSGTFTKVVFDMEKLDGLGEYNPSSYRFTAIDAGRYLFNVDLDFSFDTAATNYAYLILYKNGAEATRSLNTLTDTNGHTLSLTYNMVLAAGDYIEVYLYTAASGKVDIYSRFNGQRVY